jgi:rsbT co-antagonist protein RsbR
MSRSFERLFHLSKALLATIDLQGRFVDLNPAWERTLGWSLAELRAMQPLELVHPDDRAAAVAEGARMMAEGGIVHLENRYRCKDDSYKWLKWSSFLDPGTQDGPGLCHVTAVDITPYKEALREREAVLADLHLFKAMLENVPDVVAIVDVHNQVRYRNPAAERHFGRTSAPEEWSTAEQAHSPAFVERLQSEVLPELQRTGAWSGEGDLRRPDGTYMPTHEVLVTLRDERGAPAGVGALIRDMTGTKQMEAQLRAAVQALATPLIPISERVLVIPLIGQMDAERASQLTRVALEGVHGRGAEAVILDITGLQHLDTQVGGSLLMTARALKLLGVRTILTGIQPSVAQALIELGIDLSTVETAGNLQRAIDLATASSPGARKSQ